MQIATVVSAGQPGDQDFFTLWIDSRGIGIANGEARDSLAIQNLFAGSLAVQHITDIAESIFLELRMEGQRVNIADAFDFAFGVPAMDLGRDIEKQIGFG